MQQAPRGGDGLGRAVRLIVMAGQRGDATQAAALTEELKPRWLIADGAYDSDKIRVAAAIAGTTVCFMPNPIR